MSQANRPPAEKRHFVSVDPKVHERLLRLAKATGRNAPQMVEVLILRADWVLSQQGNLAPELHLPSIEEVRG